MAGRKRRVRTHAAFPTTRKRGWPERGCNTSEREWTAIPLEYASDSMVSDIKDAGLLDELMELLEDHAFHLEQWNWHVSSGHIITDQSDHLTIRTLCTVRRQINTRVDWRSSAPGSRRRGN